MEIATLFTCKLSQAVTAAAAVLRNIGPLPSLLQMMLHARRRRAVNEGIDFQGQGWAFGTEQNKAKNCWAARLQREIKKLQKDA